ncbi:MAG: serine/threonine protein kinase [Nannocystaceae bacterium]
MLRLTMAKSKPTEIKSGVTIHGWKVGKQLGKGGQGSVWEVRRAGVKHAPPSAMKVCVATDLKARKRFEREVEALSRLDHPGIVPLRQKNLNWECAPETEIVCSYYVTERYAGDLDSITWWKDAPIYSLKIFRLLCAAIKYMHGQKDFHRDLKPQNILFDPNSERSLVAVTDLGTVTGDDQEPVTEHREVVGTRYYRAPESHDGNYDERSDIFSLGRILGWMFTGIEPDNSDPATIPNTPRLSSAARKQLNHVIQTACAHRVADRYSSVAELMDELPSLEGDIANAPSPLSQNTDQHYREIKDTLSQGLGMEWRDRKKVIPSQTRTAMTSWHKEMEYPQSGKEEWLKCLDEALAPIERGLAFCLASLEAPSCCLGDVVFPLLNDILSPQIWGERGLRELPASILSVVHSLIGASLVMTKRSESLVSLARRQVVLPDSRYDTKQELWHVVSYFPFIPVASYREGWQFLVSLPQRHSWLESVYGSEQDFQRYLMGYCWALSVIELADIVRKKPALLNGPLHLSHIKMRVLPHMLLENREMVQRSFDDVLGDSQERRKLLDSVEITEDDFRKAWPRWKSALADYAGSLSGRIHDEADIPGLPV